MVINKHQKTFFSGFSLIELLVVVAIISIMMGVLVVSLGQTQSRGVQMASAQVASGLGLARQIAITRNTDTLFLIAPRSGTTPTDFLPKEAFRYWSVVYSNRSQNTWTLASDWKELPPGTVFVGLSGQGYNTLNWSTDGSLPSPGTPFTPQVADSRLGNWQYFNNFTNNLRIQWPSGSTQLSGVPCVGFKADGRAFANTNVSAVAVILGEGAIVGGNQISLRSTNNITHVEADTRGGRVVVRSRESYR